MKNVKYVKYVKYVTGCGAAEGGGVFPTTGCANFKDVIDVCYVISSRIVCRNMCNDVTFEMCESCEKSLLESRTSHTSKVAVLCEICERCEEGVFQWNMLTSLDVTYLTKHVIDVCDVYSIRNMFEICAIVWVFWMCEICEICDLLVLSETCEICDVWIMLNMFNVLFWKPVEKE